MELRKDYGRFEWFGISMDKTEDWYSDLSGGRMLRD